MSFLRCFILLTTILVFGLGTVIPSLAASSALEWVYQAGSTATDKGTAVAVDTNGNIYVASRTVNASVNVDLNPGDSSDIFASGSGDEIFVSKYNHDGLYLWSVAFTASGNWTEIYDLAVDTDRNRIYAVGGFTGTVDFDPGDTTHSETSNDDDGFLVALTLDGEYTDHKIFSGDGFDRVVAVDVNASGDIFLSGWFRGISDGDKLLNLNPDDEFIVANEGGESFTEAFVVKYTSSLVFSWAKAYESTNYIIIRGLAAGSDGSVYLVGRYYGQVELDNETTLSSTNGSSDALLIKLASDGTYLWSQTTHSTDFEDGYRASVDSENNIYFVGEFYAPSMDFDPTENTDLHYGDENDQGSAFLSKYAGDGTYLWTRSWGGEGYDSAGDVLVTEDDSVIAMSRTSSPLVDIDGTEGEQLEENPDESDVGVISMYTKDGNYGFGFVVGRSTGEYANAEQWAIAATGSRLYVVGQMNGNDIDFGQNGQQVLLSSTNSDIVFAAYTFDTNMPDDGSDGGEEPEDELGSGSQSGSGSSGSHFSFRGKGKAPACSAEDPTSAPDLFQIDTENGSATLYFSPASGSVTGYNVIYGFIPNVYFFGSTFDKINNNEGVQSVEINHLIPSLKYNFKVMAVNGCAPGPWSQDLGIKVLRNGRQSSFFYQ